MFSLLFKELITNVKCCDAFFICSAPLVIGNNTAFRICFVLKYLQRLPPREDIFVTAELKYFKSNDEKVHLKRL